MKSNHMLWY